MKNPRDIELLSTYLDGQLDAAASDRLKSRLSSDPELASGLKDLRIARETLRKLPMRKAPRNFTLTRKMVGAKPPLPQSFYIFRFATALAMVLLLSTFAVNAFVPRMALRAAAPAYESNATLMQMNNAAATEAPATQAPAAPEAPAPALVPNPTTMSSAAGTVPEMDTATTPAEAPTAETGIASSELQQLPEAGNETVIPPNWQVILLILALVGVSVMFVIGQAAKRKWK